MSASHPETFATPIDALPSTDLLALTGEPPLRLPPEALRQRLGDLIRGYVHTRSAPLARAVAHYSAALSLHPDLRDEPDQLAALCRLTRHWRLLAAQCETATAA